MDWTPILTAAITATVAILSAWLTAHYAARADSRRVDAEEKRTAAEHERELERMRREDADHLRADDAARREKSSNLATDISEWFLSELETLRQFREVDEDGFNTWYTDRWSEHSEVELRRVVGRVRSDDERNRLVEVIEALANFVKLAEWNWRSGRDETDRYLTLGFDIAATMFREQEPDEELSRRLIELRKDVADRAEYEARQLEAKRAALKERATPPEV